MLWGVQIHTNVIDGESTKSNKALGLRMAIPTAQQFTEMYNADSG